MKNSEDQQGHLAIQEELQRFNEDFHVDTSILIITDIDKLEIHYINQMIFVFCGIDPENILNGKREFYKEIIHPEDYPLYMEHLTSCKNLIGWEGKEIIIRLKDKDNSWNRYCFKNRLYKWNPGEEKNRVLSIAYQIPYVALPIREEEHLCNLVGEPEQTQSRYKILLDSIDEAYCTVEMIFDREGTAVDYYFTETNPAFNLHVNLGDVTGKTIRELLPEHEEFWFKIYGEIALTGKAKRFEGLAEELGSVWYDVFAFKVGNKYSRKVAILFHNITQKKRDEEFLKKTREDLEKRARNRKQELEENTQLLQAVFDNSNLAIAVFKTIYDANGCVKDFLFIQVNKVLQNLYLEQDVIGRTYLETSQYGVKMGIYDAFIQVMETGKPMDQEIFFDKKGYNHWFRITARRQNNLLIIAIEDVTAKKAESQKLKDIMRFNRQLVQTSPDTILILNLSDYKVRYVNQDMLTRAGMTKEKIQGMTLQDILLYVHPRDREKLIDFHKQILKSSEDEIHDLEFRVKTKESDWEWFNARGKIFNRKNEAWVEEYVLLVRNITTQKNTQRALINAEKLSIQGEVARTFAHELRNPLASIRMATDVIKQKLEGPQKESLENYLQILSRSTKVLNDLVSNLLNSSNYSPAVLEKVDLAECVQCTINQAADRIYLTGIKVIKNFKGPYYILADREKLNIALLNIIVNASEATNPDEGVIKLAIKKHKTDYLLTITDNGHGLEKEQIDRLFDAFYTNKTTGAGIGLTSVKNILEEHDAKIKVQSTPNEGTTFKLYFNNAEIH